MKYGTAGFRDNYEKIVNISHKLGIIIAYLSIKNNTNFGIMITASHNDYLDNGVKIVDKYGVMISKDNEKIIEDYVNDLYIIDKIPITCEFCNIYLGNDTRTHCKLVKENMINGINFISNALNIVDYDMVTTPQHHYLVNNMALDKNAYVNKFENLKDVNLNFSNLTVDCANGVGYHALSELNKIYDLSCNLINTNTKNQILLNNMSGTDYVISNNILPSNCNMVGLKASLDGDADRFIFYYYDNALNILDGDYIALLYIKYLSQYVDNNYSLAYIHTPYTNKAIVQWIKEFNPNINIVCVATGVKNLHHESTKYDVATYFESNGHGNLIINNEELKNIDIFKDIEMLNNNIVGDGICGIFCTLYFLQKLNLKYDEWYNLVVKNKNLLYKQKVKNKNLFITNAIGDKLIEPIEIQNELDIIMNKYNCYCFIRPSGTENIIRIYIESGNLNEIQKQIDILLINY